MSLAAPAAWDPEHPDTWRRELPTLEQLLDGSAQLPPAPLDAAPHSVNRAGWELLRELRGHWRDQLLARLATAEDPDERADLELSLEAAPPPDPVLATAYRGQAARFLDAWRASRVGGAVAFRLPAWPAASLDTRQQVRRQVGRRRRPLDEGVKARQRDRYKRAMADALHAFARTHAARRTIARGWERAWRPRWLDHRHDCTRPGCPGCSGIPARVASRFHRRQLGRRRDYLLPAVMTVPEWLSDRAAAMRACREAIALTEASCGGTMIIPQSCRVRTCPDCEAARQVKVVDRYAAAVEQLHPDRTRFLTLTVRNVARGELAGAIAQLMHNLERLKRRAVWKGGRCRDRGRCRQAMDPTRPGWHLPHGAVTATMTSIEVTYNAAAGTWHPHAHLILEGPYIEQAELADTWEQLTGNSRIVWIESVRKHATDRWAGDVKAALRELLKYAAKPTPAYLSEQDPAPIAELLVALRGRHLTTTAGSLFDLADPEPDESEPLVLVYPPAGGEPYRAPALCPLCGQPAAWSVAGAVARHLARRTAARAGPRRAVLTLLDSGHADQIRAGQGAVAGSGLPGEDAGSIEARGGQH